MGDWVRAGCSMLKERAGLLAGLVLFLVIVAIPVDPTVMAPAARYTAAVTALMVIWWVTEPIPIYATALLPLFLFPLLGVLNPKTAAASYADQTVFLFMGGFLIAAAMQRWNLHRRIALQIICRTGTSSKRLIFGFMVATAFLSMWISNTASAMMMIPIAFAIVSTLMPCTGDNTCDTDEERGFATCLLLAVAFAGTIGGMATLIGTPPNGILLAQLETLFPQAPTIDFFSWMVFAIPFSTIFLILAWAWLTMVAFRKLPRVISQGGEIIRGELSALGGLKGGEKWTLLVFCGVALAWIFRTPKVIGELVIPGINTFLPAITDPAIAIAGAVLLFIIPADGQSGVYTLDWDTAKTIPWGILILFGGGICLSEAFIMSGLADIIARHLTVLEVLPPILIILAISLLITYLNEVVSNTAIASIMIPLMAITAVSMEINPMLFMITAALASSLGFMLPVGTPPNAIAYGTGYISVSEMVKAGFALNIIGVVLVTVFMELIVPAVMGIQPGLPDWAIL